MLVELLRGITSERRWPSEHPVKQCVKERAWEDIYCRIFLTMDHIKCIYVGELV